MGRSVWAAWAAGLALTAAGAGARAAPVSVSPTMLRRPPVITRVASTPAQRAGDPARRLLLNRARQMAGAPGLHRAEYLKHMRALWRTKDWNQDGLVSWQGANAPENLGGQAQCVIVQYQHKAATSVKDKAHPGQYATTPETWEPVDWLTFLEVLGATSLDGGKCLASGSVDVQVCLVGGHVVASSDKPPVPPPSTCDKLHDPLCGYAPPNPTGGFAGVGAALACLGDPTLPQCGTLTEQTCKQQGGLLETHSKQSGCEEWQHFGPDSEEAFLKVAAAHFDAEDWNHNGVIDGGEGQFLCDKP